MFEHRQMEDTLLNGWHTGVNSVLLCGAMSEQAHIRGDKLEILGAAKSFRSGWVLMGNERARCYLRADPISARLACSRRSLRNIFQPNKGKGEITIMQVRAKFAVQSITLTKHWDKSKGHIATIKLNPVGGDSAENKAFYEATPCGSIELGTINEAAAAAFELGAEYYVDFTPAPKV